MNSNFFLSMSSTFGDKSKGQKILLKNNLTYSQNIFSKEPPELTSYDLRLSLFECRAFLTIRLIAAEIVIEIFIISHSKIFKIFVIYASFNN